MAGEKPRGRGVRHAEDLRHVALREREEPRRAHDRLRQHGGVARGLRRRHGTDGFGTQDISPENVR